MVNVFEATLFDRMKTRLGWLEQRQAVLAETIANADTPGYRPHDLTPPKFSEVLESGAARLSPITSDPSHLGGSGAAAAAGKKAPASRTYEVAPAGNAVVLEEQMAKVNETLLAHNLTTQLYRKYLNLVRIAATAKG
jgi:flagellar basal-body rod protein FlgB